MMVALVVDVTVGWRAALWRLTEMCANSLVVLLKGATRLEVHATISALRLMAIHCCVQHRLGKECLTWEERLLGVGGHHAHLGVEGRLVSGLVKEGWKLLLL